MKDSHRGQNGCKESLREENVVFERCGIHLTSVYHLTKHTCVWKYSTLARHIHFFSLLSSSTQPFEIVLHIRRAMQECIRVHACI